MNIGIKKIKGMCLITILVFSGAVLVSFGKIRLSKIDKYGFLFDPILSQETCNRLELWLATHGIEQWQALASNYNFIEAVTLRLKSHGQAIHSNQMQRAFIHD